MIKITIDKINNFLKKIIIFFQLLLIRKKMKNKKIYNCFFDCYIKQNDYLKDFKDEKEV